MHSVSVVLCTFNGEKFIDSQLRSVLDQVYPPTEIIISDDGSSDRTMDIVAELATDATIPIRVYQNKVQLGYAENFLTACEKATGDFIAFCDQDDIWYPEKISVALESLLKHRAVLSVHEIRDVDVSGAPVNPHPGAPGRTRVVEPLRSSPWGNYKGFTMLFRRSLLEVIPAGRRGLDVHSHGQQLAHDRWIYFLASTFGRTVIIGECLADYRQHGAQLYGGLAHRTIRVRLATKLDSGRAQSMYLSQVAGERANILEEIGPDSDNGQWQAAAGLWRRFESHLARSARIYDGASTFARLSTLAVNVSGGSYRCFRRGGLGFERFLEDLGVSLTLRRATAD